MKTFNEKEVKVAETNDYKTALEDYKAECEGAADNMTVAEFKNLIDTKRVRYVAKSDGIYYINDWVG